MRSTNSSWVPNEDSRTLFSERCWLQGAFISTLTYGINFCLYFMTVYHLVGSPNRMDFRRRLPLLVFITVLFSLGTIFMISLAGFTQMAFIDDRNYPGGPSAFENNESSIPLDDAGNVAFVLVNWLCDAFMVWRFKVIYQTSRFPVWIVLLFPCLMVACSVVLGILFLIQVSTTNPYVTNGINFTLPFLSVSLVLNMLLTVLVVARLLSFRHRLVAVLGPNHGKQYTSVAAMTVESVAIYSVMSFTFLILFGIGNAVSHVFLQSLGQIQTLAGLLIVFRIARGNGWTTDTADYMMKTHSRTVVVANALPLVGSGGMTKHAADSENDLCPSSNVFAMESA